MASALAMAVSSTSPLLPTAAMSASSTYCANCCHSACDGMCHPRGRRRGQEPDRRRLRFPLAEPPSSYRRHRKLSGPRRRVVYPYHNRTRYSSAAPYRKHRRAVRADNADSPPSTPDRPVSRSCRHCRRGHRSWFPLREQRDLPFDRSSPSLRSMPSLRRRPLPTAPTSIRLRLARQETCIRSRKARRSPQERLCLPLSKRPFRSRRP